MQNTWDNFWSSGSVGDYLLYCGAREKAAASETPRSKEWSGQAGSACCSCGQSPQGEKAAGQQAAC